MENTEQYKVIAFQRVSTESQEIEEQAKQLKDYIIKDGYSEENIITIEGFGASAIKEDDDYKMCIQQIYELLKTGNIKCIYCWELTRIFRNVKTGTSLIEYLKENKIDLKIMNPSLYLLDPITNDINTGMELAISLFTTMAAQEMRIKKARFKRAKDKNSREGKWNGGRTIPYGYKVNEDNYFIVDEGESKVVLEVFQKYATGNYSIATLSKEMNELGYDFITPHWLNNKLHSTIYIGYSKITNKDGKVVSNRIYPPIISEELYNKVQEKLQANFNGDILKQHKHHYFCSKLIKCGECGRCFIAVKNTYQCKGCSNKTSISISNIDGLAWDIVSFMDQIEFNKSKIEDLGKEVDKMKNLGHTIDIVCQYTEEEKQKTVHKYIKEIKLYPESKTTIIIDIKTVYGYLTCKYHPWNKRNIFENLSGSMMMIEPIYRDKGGKSLTIKDYVNMAAAGIELTPLQQQK